MTNENDILIEESDLIMRDKSQFKLSLSHPRKLAKGYSSPFLMNLYLPADWYQPEPVVTVVLSSPALEFSNGVTKRLSKGVNTIHFVGIPSEGSLPGEHVVLMSIRDAETDIEYESSTVYVTIVDFVFDHVSRPKLIAIVSLLSGIGAIVMWGLTLLEQVDLTWGLTSGTAALAFSGFMRIRNHQLFRSLE